LFGHRRTGRSAVAIVRAPILPGHQPYQADGGEQRRYRIGLNGIGEVMQELATAAFGVAERGIAHLPRGELTFQRVDDVADFGALLVDLALQRVGVLLCFYVYLVMRAHACPLTTSLSFCSEWMVRSGLNEEASNFF